MSKLSNYLETALFNAVLRNVSYTSPATVYLALYTSDPTDADSGTEVTGGSYARQSVTFGAPTDGAGSNSALVTFPTATADWGTVTNWGLRDASSGGNLLIHSTVGTPLAVNSGQTAKWQVGDLTVTFS